jgi:hypothetical protein
MRWPWSTDGDNGDARAAQAEATAALAQARSQGMRVTEVLRVARLLRGQVDAIAYDVEQTLRHL